MRCYVYGSNLDEERTRKNKGVVAFAIPDLGLMFKSGFTGSQSECEYVSLLTFLRFVELNPKVFGAAELEILSDAAAMVYQVSGKAPETTLAARYLPTVQYYQKKLHFSVHWIPPQENTAVEGIFDLPPLKSAPAINMQFVEPGKPKQKKVQLNRGRHFGI